MWPQLIYLGLVILGLGMTLGLHGQPQKKGHNFWGKLISSMIAISLLYWGGFFDCLLN